MKAFHKKRLLKLILHLERGKLGHPVFDFAHWNTGKKVNGCRTNGCAIGECPVLFPRQWKFESGSTDGFMDDPVLKNARKARIEKAWDKSYSLQCAAYFFGVSFETAYKMFTPDGSGLSDGARRKTVAMHLRKFLKY